MPFHHTQNTHKGFACTASATFGLLKRRDSFVLNTTSTGFKEQPLSSILCKDHGSSQSFGAGQGGLRGCKPLLAASTKEGRDSNTHPSPAGTSPPPEPHPGLAPVSAARGREWEPRGSGTTSPFPPKAPRASRRSGRSWPGWRGPARRSRPAAPPRRHTPACGTVHGKNGRHGTARPAPVPPHPQQALPPSRVPSPVPSHSHAQRRRRHHGDAGPEPPATSGCAAQTAPPVPGAPPKALRRWPGGRCPQPDKQSREV